MGAGLGAQSVSCLPETHQWAEEIPFDNHADGAIRDLRGAGGNTVLIIDWDDTLLCSTALRTHQCRVGELQKLEVAIETILRTAMSLGETLIVTNGNANWVQNSASQVLPGLLPILSEVRIVSARALYEDRYPGDPFMWKQAAFEHLLIKERHFHPQVGMNLVALGDQFPEIDAARHVTALIGGSSLVKTVKFREAPSVVDLLGQLQRMDQTLSHIAQATESHSYVLVQHLSLLVEPSLADSGWRCMAEQEKHEIGCVDPMKDLRELVVSSTKIHA